MFTDITIFVYAATTYYGLSSVVTVRSRSDYIAAYMCLACDSVRYPGCIDKRLTYFFV